MSSISLDFHNSIEEDLIKMLRGKINFQENEEENESISRENTNNSSQKDFDQADSDEKQNFSQEQESTKSRKDHKFNLDDLKKYEMVFFKEQIVEFEEKNSETSKKMEKDSEIFSAKFYPVNSIIINNESIPTNSFLSNNPQIHQINSISYCQKNPSNEFFLKFYQNFQGQFYSLCLSQNGSKLLQDYLKIIPSHILSKIFEEIKHNLPDLILSKYGNYFCRMLYHFIQFDEKCFFLKAIKENFFQISKSNIGTYPLQSIIEQVTTLEEKFLLIECIKANEVLLPEMTTDEYSVHVIDKLISVCDEILACIIYRFCFDNFIFLALNKNGIFLIKKIISKSRGNIMKNKILHFVNENFSMMINDSYANYAIQYIIEHWDDYYFSLIFKNFLGRLTKFSCQKFPSIVVEKILEKGRENIIRLLIFELSDKSNLFQILNNKYGMYVIKKALNISTFPTKVLLLQLIENNINIIQDKVNVINWLNACQYHRNLMSRNMNSRLNFNM